MKNKAIKLLKKLTYLATRGERGKNMKKYFIAYWKNLHRKEMTIEAYDREDARRRFRELTNTDTTAIIQVKEISQ